MQLIFLHGAPAVGKLTVARELAEITGFKVFHNHLTVDLVGSVFPFGSESFIQLREEIWLATFRQAAKHATSLIFTFAPEGTVRPQFIQQAIDMIESAGGEVVFVELTCDEAELEQRLVAPSRSKFDKLQSVEQYHELKSAGAFEFPKIVSQLSVNTTHSSPAATAKLISERL
ncbi:MAG TPA: AAA family ATPase [Pyrinomonadaceae bacterium]|nr:AAA family ATPase [Pyrinomonadaceae bacterium]